MIFGKLHRYVLFEVFVFVAGAVAVFLFVFLTGNAVRGAIAMLAEGQISLRLFFQILWMMIPYVGVYALPLGFLAGILLALGRLSSTREILAMKASGSSVWSIARPIFLMALIGCGFSAWFNNELGPKNKGAYRERLANSLEEDPLRFFKAGSFVRDFPGYVVFVQERDGEEMRGFEVWELGDEGRVSRYLHAESARIEFLREQSTLLFTLRNGRFEDREPNPNYDQPPTISLIGNIKEFPLRLELDSILRRGTDFSQKPSYLTFSQLREQIREDPENSLEYRVQIQQNLAMSISIFSLVIVAIPLGIRVGRKETLTNLGVALGLAMLYYFLVTVATWFMEVPAALPELLIWLPNVLFISLGIWLMNRANQH
ncbi:MAG: LptF/LptG family permease [Verrucomicrobiota bacterium]